jgi:putative ABC transport system permease protein
MNMLGIGRTPLAWKNMTHDVRRLLIAVSGVTFAVVLMFMERGFQNALFDSTVALVKILDADIVLNSKSRYSLSSSSRFPTNKITLAGGCDGVAAAYPIYIENYMAVLRKPKRHSRPIRVVGFDIRADLLTDQLAPVLDRYRPELLAPHTAIIDIKSKESIYGIDPTLPQPAKPLIVFLAEKKISLVGTFELGTDFANDGTLFMSVDNFARYFSFREMPADPLSTADLGLVMCEDEREITDVCRRLRAELGDGMDVRTRAEFIADEISFWDNNTPIGVIFKVGVIMGFVVGVLICYQVLYNDISDHMPEFATLMAMGYPRRYFVSLVVREAVYLALLGFVPGVAICWVLFQIISTATGLTMTLTLFECGLILSFTVVMCVLSGLLAVRKLLAADPASLF